MGVWAVRVVAAVGLGVALFLLGGVSWVPAPAACPGCAVAVQDWPGCDGQQVQGGWSCN